MILHRIKGMRIQAERPHKEPSQSEALIKLSQLQLGYVPWTSSAMTPRAIVHVLNEIIVNKRTRILELGMGVSSFFIAKLSQHLDDVRLLSFDHDSGWIDICRRNLSAKGLSADSHLMIHAPIERKQGLGINLTAYYDVSVLKAALKEFGPADMLIVDGPPAYEAGFEKARLPAHKIFAPFISKDATIFIDDYLRPGETELVDAFSSAPAWRVILKDPAANVCILVNNQSRYNSF